MVKKGQKMVKNGQKKGQKWSKNHPKRHKIRLLAQLRLLVHMRGDLENPCKTFVKKLDQRYPSRLVEAGKGEKVDTWALHTPYVKPDFTYPCKA